MATSRPMLHAYVDETGDRGTSRNASEWFALTAVLIPSEDEWLARTMISGFRSEVVNTSRALHWSEHLKPKHAARRQRMATLLSLLTPSVIVVATHKRCIRANAASRTDGSAFYNYAYRLLLERVAYAARDWPGGPRFARVRADSVKGMDHGATVTYLELVRDNQGVYSRYPVPWRHITWPPTWHASSAYDGLQLADMYSAILGCALRAESDEWLTPWMHQIRGSFTPQIWRRGFKLVTDCQARCLVPNHEWARELERIGGEHRRP